MKAADVSMHAQFVLLFTRDTTVARQLATALDREGATLLTAEGLSDVIQILHHHGRALDLAVLDFDHGARGITLLAAIHSWREELPIVVLTGSDAAHTGALAYAHGARSCLQKPFATEELADLLTTLRSPSAHLVAA
jgi:DNA-binding NtrC family response regulator